MWFCHVLLLRSLFFFSGLQILYNIYKWVFINPNWEKLCFLNLNICVINQLCKVPFNHISSWIYSHSPPSTKGSKLNKSIITQLSSTFIILFGSCNFFFFFFVGYLNFFFFRFYFDLSIVFFCVSLWLLVIYSTHFIIYVCDILLMLVFYQY